MTMFDQVDLSIQPPSEGAERLNDRSIFFSESKDS